MKVFSILLGALALVAGIAGGVHAYSASAGPAPAPVAAAPSYPPAQVVRPGIVLRWAPCRPPAVRQGRACVTHVVHTVVLPAPVQPAAPASSAAAPRPHATAAPTAAPSTSEPGDDGGHHEHGDDGGHDGGGDD